MCIRIENNINRPVVPYSMSVSNIVTITTRSHYNVVRGILKWTVWHSEEGFSVCSMFRWWFAVKKVYRYPWKHKEGVGRWDVWYWNHTIENINYIQFRLIYSYCSFYATVASIIERMHGLNSFFNINGFCFIVYRSQDLIFKYI